MGTLVVVCSWVAFWIVKTDTPSRTSLGIITILSVTKIGFGGKTKPKVGYSTALDIYNIICFAFTFAALFEFVLINFIGMFVQRYKAEEEAKQQVSPQEKTPEKLKTNGQKSSMEAEEDPGSDSEVEEDNDVESEVRDVPKIVLWFRHLQAKIPRSFSFMTRPSTWSTGLMRFPENCSHLLFLQPLPATGLTTSY